MIDRKKILVEVSNRHVHFSRMDLDVLFGERFRLIPVRELSQPGQFVSENSVDLIGLNGKIERLRVLGPERKESQAEILKSDVNRLGIEAPVRLSGDLEGSPGIRVAGPLGVLNLRKGVIRSQRHLHASDEEADELGIRNGERIGLRIGRGKREFILENIFVRKGEGHSLAIHIDKDEGDKIGLRMFGFGEII